MTNEEISTLICENWKIEIGCDDLKLSYYLEGYPYGYLDNPVALFIPQSVCKLITESKIFDGFEKLMLLPIENQEDLDIAYSSITVDEYKHILLDYIKKHLGEMVYKYILDYNFYAQHIYDTIKPELNNVE